jgi:outer membrane protein TolC
MDTPESLLRELLAVAHERLEMAEGLEQNGAVSADEVLRLKRKWLQARLELVKELEEKTHGTDNRPQRSGVA